MQQLWFAHLILEWLVCCQSILTLNYRVEIFQIIKFLVTFAQPGFCIIHWWIYPDVCEDSGHEYLDLLVKLPF